MIFGDDIGTTNLSCYSDGVMGYDTPHIDRLANEGLRFLHYYGEQSCTAGRAAFPTGQHGLRTGLTNADVTSNTYWDWNLNHVGAAYGMMEEVFEFIATVKQFPPRAFPPSFNPANLMEETLHGIQAGRKLLATFPMLRSDLEKAHQG